MQRIGSWLATKLDKDGDGKVTVDEVEEIIDETTSKITKTVAPVLLLLLLHHGGPLEVVILEMI